MWRSTSDFSSMQRIPRPGNTARSMGSFCMACALMIGWFFYTQYRHDRQMWDHGVRVVGVVSDKHRIEGQYHRLFFQPPPDLPEDARDLWERTSAKTRYPRSVVELFEDWDDRIWVSVSPETYGPTKVGREIPLRIDGQRTEIAKLSPPGTTSFWVIGGLFLTGAWMLASGIRTGWREDVLDVTGKRKRRRRRRSAG